MNYNANQNHGYGYGYYYGNNYGYQPPIQPASPMSGYDPVSLQMRIIRARQINVMCKQALVKNYLSSKCDLNEGSVNLNSYSPIVADSTSGGQTKLSPDTAQPREKTHARDRGSTMDGCPNYPTDLMDSKLFNKTDYGDFSRALPSTTVPKGKKDATAHVRLHSAQKNDFASKETPTPNLDEDDNRAAVSTDQDDDSVPIDQSTPMPNRAGQREEVKLLNSLAESMTKTVTDSGDVLKKLNAKKNRLPAAEKAKKKMAQLIKVNANAPVVMPLWRHKLLGRSDPPKETVLKGVRLFRVIVKAILYLFIKPTVAVMRRKLSAREHDHKDLQKTLKLLAGNFDDWLGKLVQLPVTSVTQDGTLNFEPAESIVLNTQPLKTRMLQLKVRLRAVVSNIAKADMPSDFLTDSLITLVEDGNYFSRGLLWDCEVDQMDFNSLGGTRNMIPPAGQAPEPFVVGSGKFAPSSTENIVTLSVKEEVSIGGTSGNVTVAVYARRVRLLLQNFLLVRTLVAHLLLAPWHCGLCAPPSQRAAKRILYNHRVLATTVYELVRRIDPSLPAVGVADGSAAKPASADKQEEAEKFIAPKRAPDAPYVIGDAMVAATRRKMKALTPSSSATGLPSLPAVSTTTTAVAAISTVSNTLLAAISTKAGRAVTAPSGSTLSNGIIEQSPALKNTTKTEEAHKAALPPNRLLLKLSKMIGMGDAAVLGVEAPSQGSIESALLEPGEDFDFPTHPQLLSLLLPAAQLAPLRVYWDEWFAELRGPLDAWLQRLVVHVLTRRMKQKLDREAKEGAAAGLF